MIAVILAAGLSKRFDGKKLLEKVKGKAMVFHVAELVSSLDFEQKIFVYSDEEVLEAALDNCNKTSEFQFLFNSQAAEGLSTSIRLAAENLLSNPKEDGIIFFVADQPFLDEATVNRLTEAFYRGKGTIIVPVYQKNRGNPVIFSGKWLRQLKNLEGDIGGRTIIRENPEEVWEVPISDCGIGRDIDTREEYMNLCSERNSNLHEDTK